MTAPMTNEEWAEKYHGAKMMRGYEAPPPGPAHPSAALSTPDTPRCIALAVMPPEQEVIRTPRMRSAGTSNPQIEGVFGTWLDEDGFVLPEFRERAAKARLQHRRSMERIEDVAVIAQARTK